MVWSIRHGGSMWVIGEHSRRFWMVVQGKEKWKKINKVRYPSKRGHDIGPLPLDRAPELPYFVSNTPFQP